MEFVLSLVLFVDIDCILWGAQRNHHFGNLPHPAPCSKSPRPLLSNAGRVDMSRRNLGAWSISTHGVLGSTCMVNRILQSLRVGLKFLATT